MDRSNQPSILTPRKQVQAVAAGQLPAQAQGSNLNTVAVNGNGSTRATNVNVRTQSPFKFKIPLPVASSTTNAPASCPTFGADVQFNGIHPSSSSSFYPGPDPGIQRLERRVRLLEHQIKTCLESQHLMYDVYNRCSVLEDRFSAFEQLEVPTSMDQSDTYGTNGGDTDDAGTIDTISNHYLDQERDHDRDGGEIEVASIGRLESIGVEQDDESQMEMGQDENMTTSTTDAEEGHEGGPDPDPPINCANNDDTSKTKGTTAKIKNNGTIHAQVQIQIAKYKPKPGSRSRGLVSMAEFNSLQDNVDEDEDSDVHVNGDDSWMHKCKLCPASRPVPGPASRVRRLTRSTATYATYQELAEHYSTKHPAPKGVLGSPSRSTRSTRNSQSVRGAVGSTSRMKKAKKDKIKKRNKLKLGLRWSGRAHSSKYRANTGKDDDERKYPCAKCGKRFAKSWQLNQHMKRTVHSPSNWQCDTCDQTFKWKTSLPRHMMQVHGASFATAHAAITVAAVASPPKVINATTSTTSTNTKKYPCPKCGKGFPKKGHLKQHMATHEAPRFGCDSCDRMFMWKHSLIKHQMYLHGAGGPPRPRSDESAHSFSSKEDKDIKDKHHKTIPCPKCEKRFATNWHLTLHSVKHTGPSWPCNSCDRIFRWKNKLLKHQMDLHGASAAAAFSAVAAITAANPSKATITNATASTTATATNTKSPPKKKRKLKPMPRNTHGGRRLAPAVYFCPEPACGLTFASRWNLTNHSLTHTTLPHDATEGDNDESENSAPVEKNGRKRPRKQVKVTPAATPTPPPPEGAWLCPEGCGFSSPHKGILVCHQLTCKQRKTSV